MCQVEMRKIAKVLVAKSCLTLHNLMLFCPWDFPGKNTGVGSHFLLQGIFLTQESNPVSSALAGGFFTTVPPGKPKHSVG